MGKCSCYGSSGTFSLKASTGWYRIIVSPPCDVCGDGWRFSIAQAGRGYDPRQDESLDEEVVTGVTFRCLAGIRHAAGGRLKSAIYETYIGDDLPVAVGYSTSPAEPMTREYPGCPASIEIESVTHDGRDLIGVLNEMVLDEITERIANHLDGMEGE